MDVYVSRVRSRPLVVVDDFALIVVGKEREEMSASERVRKERFVLIRKLEPRGEERQTHFFVKHVKRVQLYHGVAHAGKGAARER